MPKPLPTIVTDMLREFTFAAAGQVAPPPKPQDAEWDAYCQRVYEARQKAEKAVS